MKSIKLQLPQGGERIIGPEQPIFISAEIGVTCNYEMDRAKKLIDIVAKAGADAVKMAFHVPEDLLSDHSVRYKYPTVNGEREENMFEMFNYLRFSFDEWQEIKEYADSKNLILFCSLAGGGIKWAEELNLQLHKLGAWDLLDAKQFKYLRESGKPLVIDVGTINEEEMGWMLKQLGDLPVVLLHEYHTQDFSQMNIKAVKYIAERFDVQVGFSSPDSYDVNDFLSISLGATALEKRLTLSHAAEGHHHVISKEPDDFIEYVKQVRQAEIALGNKIIKPSDCDLKERDRFFKRVVASKPIVKGETLTEDNTACRRPEINGISSRYYFDLMGTISDKNYNENDPIVVRNFSI
jgi:sialic acid synthase SpsE